MPGTASVMGNGSNTSASIVGGVIDTTGTSSYACSMPRDGTITAIAAYLSTSNAVALVGTTVRITVQLYSSATPDDLFTPAAGTSVVLAPSLTGVISIGTNSSGITNGLNIPVTAGTRLMLVYSAQVIAGLDVATTISGYASAGVNIA